MEHSLQSVISHFSRYTRTPGIRNLAERIFLFIKNGTRAYNDQEIYGEIKGERDEISFVLKILNIYPVDHPDGPFVKKTYRRQVITEYMKNRMGNDWTASFRQISRGQLFEIISNGNGSPTFRYVRQSQLVEAGLTLLLKRRDRVLEFYKNASKNPLKIVSRPDPEVFSPLIRDIENSPEMLKYL